MLSWFQISHFADKAGLENKTLLNINDHLYLAAHILPDNVCYYRPVDNALQHGPLVSKLFFTTKLRRAFIQPLGGFLSVTHIICPLLVIINCLFSKALACPHLLFPPSWVHHPDHHGTLHPDHHGHQNHLPFHPDPHQNLHLFLHQSLHHDLPYRLRSRLQSRHHHLCLL